MIWGCEHDYNIRRNRGIKTGYGARKPISERDESVERVQGASASGCRTQAPLTEKRSMMIAAHTSLEVAQACEEDHRKDRLSTSVFQCNFGLRLVGVRPALAEETGSPDVPDHGSEMGAKPVDEILATAARTVVFPGERN
jgi:hypothetical protein